MIYREHTVQLISTQDPETGKWTPKATVIYNEAGTTHLRDSQPRARDGYRARSQRGRVRSLSVGVIGGAGPLFAGRPVEWRSPRGRKGVD
jgi:hypothetical protein